MVLVKFVSLTRREGTVSCPPDPSDMRTAIAVIKNDPESLPKGEPQNFAEK